ncbi:MAG: glutamate--tRNA ligase [Elusimicrobia bacterium]|nr:glutamate--tRNA ligase [Elusimicrobiota bacterium]
MNSNIRVRFAPSPTGDLHIGGVRTALFNWLFARHTGGKFILRIEDTDEARSTDESVKVILDAMKWLNLNWDEGPGSKSSDTSAKYGSYYQMQRKTDGIYQKYADILLEKGLAYRCYCTPEEVDAMRKKAQAEKKPPKYDGSCFGKQDGSSDKSAVIRFKMPVSGNIVLEDIVRGNVEFDNSLLDDFVIMKANGTPTYNFACVVDDYLMEMSHIIRGDDHISNTPRQLHLYKAFGWELPKFAHLSMIMGSDGARLSKRHGHTSVLEYMQEGYLNEVLINYLALLGWSTVDSQQLFDLPDLINKFSLEGCGSSPATFDTIKLLWMQGEYIRKKTPAQVYDLFMTWISQTNNQKLIEGWGDTLVKKGIELEHEKIKLLAGIPALISFFFDKEVVFEEESVNKVFLSDKSKETARLVLTESAVRLKSFEPFTAEGLEQYSRDLATEKGIKTGQVFHPLRVSTSGRTQGPSLFHMLEVFGRDEVVKRIDKALEIYFK